MEVQPVSAQDTQVASPMSKRKPWLLFLAVALVVILLFVLVLAYISKSSQNAPSSFLGENISFSDEGSKAKYIEFVRSAFNTNSAEGKSTNLIKAFLTLSVDYNSQPAEDKRQLLAKLNDYLYKNFPQQVKEAKIAVPCREESCGVVFDYSNDLLAVKGMIDNLKIDDLAKKSLLHNLDNTAMAAGSNDINSEFNSLNALFFDLKSVWDRQKDDSIKVVAQAVVSELEKTDSKNFAANKKVIDYELK